MSRITSFDELIASGTFTKKEVELLADWLEPDDIDYEKVKELWEQIENYHEENFFLACESIDHAKEMLAAQGIEIPKQIVAHIDWEGVAEDMISHYGQYEVAGETIYAY